MNRLIEQQRGYRVICLGAILSFLSVAAGAFGAHGAKPLLTSELFAIYETAVQYQFYHSIALLVVGAIMVSPSALNPKYMKVAVVSFVIGILLFSGSLYAYAFTGIKQLGMITPVGGLLFLIGWLMLALSAWGACEKHRH